MDAESENHDEHGELAADALRCNRVDPEISPQQHARELSDLLEKICDKLEVVKPNSESTSSFPKRTAEGLIRDSQSLLEGIETMGISLGNSRISNSLLRALELLEQGGDQYNQVAEGLITAIALASQRGLTIDGYNLLPGNSQVGRLRGG